MSSRANLSENEILKSVFPFLKQGRNVIVGPGDDCAVLDFGLKRLFLIAVDQVVSGVHYDSKLTPPSKIAKKLLKRNLSDIAAMGGTPAHAVLTIAANFAGMRSRKKWFNEFFRSLGSEASRWGVSVCGGDLAKTKGHATVCTLTICGWVEKKKLCLRSGAKSGDFLYTTGVYGNSYASGHHLNFIPRLKEAEFLAGTFTNTMIDVSDGLLADAERLADASGKSLVLDTESIPRRKGAKFADALSEGEDYELLFAVSPEKSKILEKKWPLKNVKLTKIGEFRDGNPGTVTDKNGKSLRENYKMGYDHFSYNAVSVSSQKTSKKIFT